MYDNSCFHSMIFATFPVLLEQYLKKLCEPLENKRNIPLKNILLKIMVLWIFLCHFIVFSVIRWHVYGHWWHRSYD